MSGRDDVATDEDIIGNAAESKSPTITSPSDQLHPILMEDCTELGNVVKSNEILDPTCKSEVHNNNVFQHLMQCFFDSENHKSTPPSPIVDDVPRDPTLFE